MLVREWSEEEELFLKENYPKFGAKYCSEQLNRTIIGIRTRAKKLKIKWEKVKDRYYEENLREVINDSKSIGDVLDKLNLRRAGGNYKVINNYINSYKISIEHFEKPSNILDRIRKIIPLDEILVVDSNYSRTNLKKRLLDNGLLKNICCLCGQDENWNGMKISLILDHINGVYNDNRIENLRIVCPNCNAGLDTFAGKNSKKIKNREIKKVGKKIKNDKNYNYIDTCSCGKKKLKSSNVCEGCFHEQRRKVERPPIEQLLKEVDEMGYSATGRKYGVSDNAIRKWIKNK